jgi:TRAP-type mannitol/chloroaromatic compound transport system permease small subunit
MAAYYILGGSYALLMGSQVRMDLFYDRWSAKRRAVADAITASAAAFYIVIFIVGGINSTIYALKYGQITYSPWGPPLAPIKIIFVAGATLMLLQIIANFFRDLAIARGKPIT